MKILLDMNLSPLWVAFLEAAGHEAEHWSTIGARNAPDREILAYAARVGAVLFTHDLDFGALLAASGDSGPSVLQMREPDVTPEGIGHETLAAVAAFEADLILGALVTVDARRAKVSILPLARRR